MKDSLFTEHSGYGVATSRVGNCQIHVPCSWCEELSENLSAIAMLWRVPGGGHIGARLP
jgi:hypothetical protein